MKGILVALALTGLSLAGGQAAENLLENGSLKEGDSGWVFYPGRDNKEFVDGRFETVDDMGALMIKMEAGPGSHCWWSQEVAVEPGADYAITVEARSPGSDHRCYVLVAFLDDTGKEIDHKMLVTISDTQPISPKQITNDQWRVFDSHFVVPDGFSRVRLRLGLGGKGEGEAWFRNIQMEKVK